MKKRVVTNYFLEYLITAIKDNPNGFHCTIRDYPHEKRYTSTKKYCDTHKIPYILNGNLFVFASTFKKALKYFKAECLEIV